MRTFGNVEGVDERGAAVLWSSEGQQVMMQWERAYMETCVDALRIEPNDRVLEIGFGLGYSATHIQDFLPTRHTIVECDAAGLRAADAFAVAHAPRVDVLRGTWQAALPELCGRHFDCVFFDDYPLPELEALGVTHNSSRSLRSRSRWHEFLDVVLPLVAVGGRITGYLARDIDLERRGCRVAITQVRVQTAENCTYFLRETALVPVITVSDESAGSDAGAGCEEERKGVSETRLRVPLPVQVAPKVLRRVVQSVQLGPDVSLESNPATPAPPPSSSTSSDASSSRRRRFAAICACLLEQNRLLDAEPTEHFECQEDDSDAEGRQLARHLPGRRDQSTRKQFIAGLRQKHQDQLEQRSAKPRDRTYTQWSRPRVQPQDLAEPLSCPRPSSQPPKKAPSAQHHRSKQVHALLVRRVCRMRDYIDELRGRTGPRKYVPGAPTQPIPVPLAYGETLHEYESRFVAFLETKNKTLDELRDDPNHERSLRMHFATKRAHEAMARESKKRKHRSASPPSGGANPARGVRVAAENTVSSEEEDDDGAAQREPPRKKRGRYPSPSPARSVSTTSSQPESVSGRPLAPPPLVVVERRAVPAPAPADAPAEPRCTAQLPDSHAPSTAFVAAYVECGCKQCMRDWNLMLTERLVWLETEVRDLRALKRGHAVAHGSARESQRLDLPPAPGPSEQRQPAAPDTRGTTEKADTVSSQATDTSGESPNKQVAIAAVEQLTPDAGKAPPPPPTTGTVASSAAPRQEGSGAGASVPAASTAAASIVADERPHATSSAAPFGVAPESLTDPIRARMVEEYNTLNSQILANEHVMADMLERVQASMLEDMGVAMQEHEQLQQLQAVIQTDVASRDKALAMLLAYCSDQPALRAQVARLGSLNVAHVQSASHAKCAALAAHIQATQDNIAGLQNMLERVITGDAASRDGARAAFLASGIDELNLLGEQIAGEEQALEALEAERMGEFMRLFQFSVQVRTACGAILSGREKDGGAGP
ncbi:hypothetical protein PybrP1_004098 [[Pythium] brassicae (nom. inval.)]|nr:hypothetical protein PybrP1_004098 [[Pythium] brassicae (nom. inval.)]